MCVYVPSSSSCYLINVMMHENHMFHVIQRNVRTAHEFTLANNHLRVIIESPMLFESAKIKDFGIRYGFFRSYKVSPVLFSIFAGLFFCWPCARFDQLCNVNDE